ncbi:MAG: pantoate--beta-alanine ligase [Verrucomicrobiae bacterium]|nr:pantoate--beta-alanine ligase [Verrucomicrobiae bacterium]
MEIIREPAKMQRKALSLRARGRRIAFVPTMGALHEGHLGLVDLARRHGDVVVMSIYVNPTQFGPREDFSQYPRPFRRDAALARSRGVDLLFNPANLYGPSASTWVLEEKLGMGLCGGSRPGHFRGVTTVVAKLFNLVLPHTAVFGQKDAQQVAVIERMVADLDFPIRILRAPIAREKDGLAMSSRNIYLAPAERLEAPALRQSLLFARKSATRLTDPRILKKQTLAHLHRLSPLARVDYMEFVHFQTLQPLPRILRGETLAALAVFYGKTRLIDNIIF